MEHGPHFHSSDEDEDSIFNEDSKDDRESEDQLASPRGELDPFHENAIT